VRKVIIAADVPSSGEWKVPKGCIITPSARDLIAARGIKIVEVSSDQLDKAPPEKTVALGSDHGGFVLKKTLMPLLAELGLRVIDVGTDSEKPVDYPDIARAVAEVVASGKAARGIVIDGAGIGSAIVANKFPGIRAALCYDKASAKNSREHNDSNVLTLGGRLLTQSQAEDVLRVWLSTPFAGGRHAARVQKIAEIEKAIRNWTPRS
jgi:ribose 5-phosphate isomerase B